MPTNTYVALDKITVGTATATVTFNSIPQGYTDLVMIVSAKTNTTAAQIYMTINGDTGSNYSRTILYGTGSAAGSARNSNQTVLFADYYGIMNTTDFNMDTFHFMNYSNTTTYKTVLSRTNLAASGVDAMAHLWRSTSAITSILVGNYGYNFAVGSTFSLYGIAAIGGDTTPKATGGVVTSDATYYYHTFAGSNTFTALQSLSADILVIAGGGGGGTRAGGGGGAGGLLAFTSQSLTATSYGVLIGAGGTGAPNTPNTASGSVGGDSRFGSLTLVKGGGLGGGATVNGGTGGSGGGGGNSSSSGGSATSGQGNAGDVGSSSRGGGGGGSAAAGQSGTTSGNGGAGVSTYSSWGSVTSTGQNISGTYYYAGGAGGGANSSVAAGTGGAGGGGNGSGNDSPNAGTSGTANTGGGGGGGGSTSSGVNTAGGAGGSGIVIVRYAK